MWLFSTVCNEGGWELHTDVVDRVASRSDRPLTLRQKKPRSWSPGRVPRVSTVGFSESEWNTAPLSFEGSRSVWTFGRTKLHVRNHFFYLSLFNKPYVLIRFAFLSERDITRTWLVCRTSFCLSDDPVIKKWDVIGVRVRAHFRDRDAISKMSKEGAKIKKKRFRDRDFVNSQIRNIRNYFLSAEGYTGDLTDFFNWRHDASTENYFFLLLGGRIK